MSTVPTLLKVQSFLRTWQIKEPPQDFVLHLKNNDSTALISSHFNPLITKTPKLTSDVFWND